MNTTQSSGNLVDLNDQHLSSSSSLSSLKCAPYAAVGNRKRRRAPTHLARINLVLSPNNNNNLSTSAESLSGGSVAVDCQLSSNASSSSGSDDDCLTPTPSASAGSVYDDLQPSFVSSLTAGDEYEKRSRLSSFSKNPATAGGSSTTAGIQSASVCSSPVPSHFLQRSLSSAPAYAGNDKIGDYASVSTNLADDYYDLAELECSQSGSAGSTNGKASGGLRIGDGTFELVGDGRDCKAVNIQTQSVYHCQILKVEEYKYFLEVVNRLQSAHAFYDGPDYGEMKNLIVPDGTLTLRGNSGDAWYVLTPDHFGNLHTLIHASFPANNGNSNNKDAGGNGGASRNSALDERRIQPIFKQIVALVRFCHAIGIYFRDFRLRKFVFTDRNRKCIRINSALDLCVAPNADDDQMTERHVCPAYVAPEILDVRSTKYAGRSADIWALGVLLFILLTNHYPFYDQNHTALFRRIRARRLSFLVPERISPNARWLLHALLRLDPLERPCAADILQSHWLQNDPDLLPENVEQYSSNIVQRITISSSAVNGENETSALHTRNNGADSDSTESSTSDHIRVVLERSNSTSPSTSSPSQGTRRRLRLNHQLVTFIHESGESRQSQGWSSSLSSSSSSSESGANNAVVGGHLSAASLQQTLPQTSSTPGVEQPAPTAASMATGWPAGQLSMSVVLCPMSSDRMIEKRREAKMHNFCDQMVPTINISSSTSKATVVSASSRPCGSQNARRQHLSLNIARTRTLQMFTCPTLTVAAGGVAISPTSTHAVLSPSVGDAGPRFSTATSSSSILVASGR